MTLQIHKIYSPLEDICVLVLYIYKIKEWFILKCGYKVCNNKLIFYRLFLDFDGHNFNRIKNCKYHYNVKKFPYALYYGAYEKIPYTLLECVSIFKNYSYAHDVQRRFFICLCFKSQLLNFIMNDKRWVDYYWNF